MLLRTSSAPLAQSLFLHCPGRDVEADITSSTKYSSLQEHSAKNISFGHGLEHLCSVSCRKSSSSNVVQKGSTVGRKMIRRSQSDGNMERLASPVSSDIEGVYSSIMVMSKSVNDLQKVILEAEPSFAIYGKDDKYEEVANDELVNGNIDSETGIKRTATIGESVDSQFCFGCNTMHIIKEDDNEEEEVEEAEENEFKGLDSDSQCEPSDGAITNVDAGGFLPLDCHGNLENYYKKILREDPSNPLFLSNYGHHLEMRPDFSGAEDCYACASLAVPDDGEILAKYANLLWEVNGDEARASYYFNQAAIVAPENSSVLAAYANFLWNTGFGDEEDENLVQVGHPNKVFRDEERPSSPPLHLAWGLGIDNPFVHIVSNKNNHLNLCSDDSGAIEDYYQRMIEGNPQNSMFLGDYARFLHQTKGDLRGAEEYYSRAILEDPSDAQALYLYADVLWQLYRDTDRAASYYERAIQAAPNDCNALAAYAKFLWDSEPDDDAIQRTPDMIPVSFAGTAISTALA